MTKDFATKGLIILGLSIAASYIFYKVAGITPRFVNKVNDVSDALSLSPLTLGIGVLGLIIVLILLYVLSNM